MAWIGAAIGAASTIGSALLKKDGDEKDQTLGATNTAGWTGDTPGGTEQAQAPKTDDQVKTSFPRTNEFLSSNLGKLGTDTAGSFLGDYRQQRNTKKNFEFLRGQGLTPAEIAGGSTGGPVSAQGNTLGSGPATQIVSQQSFAADQAERDRANRKEVAHIGAAAAGRQAGVSETRDRRDAIHAPLQRQKTTADTDLTNQSLKRSIFDLENVWAMKFASMSMENGMFALAAFNQGIDFRKVLSGQGTPQERRESEELFNIMLKASGPGKAIISMYEVMKQFAGGTGTLESGSMRQMLEGLSPNQMQGRGSTRGGRGATGEWDTKNSRGATGQWR